MTADPQGIIVTGPAPTVTRVIDGTDYAVTLTPNAGQQRDMLRRLARAIARAGLMHTFYAAGYNSIGPHPDHLFADDQIGHVFNGIDHDELFATVLNPDDAEQLAWHIDGATEQPDECSRDCQFLVDDDIDPDLCERHLADCEQDENWADLGTEQSA